jgi:predicted DNA-binding transcriptional regulator YafY
MEDQSRGQAVLSMFFEFIKNPHQTPREIQEKLGLTKDKYHRYFNEIGRVVPVSYNRKRKCFEFVSGTDLRALWKSPEDFYSFLLAVQATGQGRTGKESCITGKLRGMPGFSPDFDSISKFVLFISPNDSGSQISTNLFIINNAISSRRRIRFIYTKMGQEPYEAVVEPYRIVFDQSWYLNGFALNRGEKRIYRLSRMKDIIVTEESFEMPPEQDIHIKRIGLPWDFGDDPPVKVVLEFNESALGYVREKALHPSEQYSAPLDGKFLYTVHVSSPLNMSSWILSFGPSVRVLEPEELKNKVVSAIIGMASLYE